MNPPQIYDYPVAIPAIPLLDYHHHIVQQPVFGSYNPTPQSSYQQLGQVVSDADRFSNNHFPNENNKRLSIRDKFSEIYKF